MARKKFCIHIYAAVNTFFLASVYISCIIGGFCVNGSIPLLFELVVELTYPVPETVSIAFISVVNNLFAFIFLLILGIPNIGN